MKNKKIVFTDIWKVEIDFDEISKSNINENEILVKNHYSLISAGTELACLSGKESSWFKFPTTPGYCAVGEVIVVGQKVTDFSIGDMVFYYGAHKTYNTVNVKDALCVKLINGMDIKYAPFARIATIAMTSLRISSIELGDYVAVAGLGMVGNIAAQLAQLQGGKVIGFDLDIEHLKKAKECGVTFTGLFDKSTLETQVNTITSGNGIQTLIDATGISSTILDCLPIVSKNGEVILLGTPRDQYICDVTDTLRHIHLADRAIKFKGAHEWMYPVKQNKFLKHSFERNTIICLELIRDGKLKLDPFLTHIIKPDNAAEAYEGLKEKKNEYIGVLIDWTKE